MGNSKEILGELQITIHWGEGGLETDFERILKNVEKDL